MLRYYFPICDHTVSCSKLPSSPRTSTEVVDCGDDGSFSASLSDESLINSRSEHVSEGQELGDSCKEFLADKSSSSEDDAMVVVPQRLKLCCLTAAMNGRP